MSAEINSAALASTDELLRAGCSHARAALQHADIARLLPLVPGWSIEGGRLCRSFGFNNYDDTMAFVYAIAQLSKQEDHHPELTVTHKNCVVRYHTHSVNNGNGGLSANDFICAAKAAAQAAAQGAA